MGQYHNVKLLQMTSGQRWPGDDGFTETITPWIVCNSNPKGRPRLSSSSTTTGILSTTQIVCEPQIIHNYMHCDYCSSICQVWITPRLFWKNVLLQGADSSLPGFPAAYYQNINLLVAKDLQVQVENDDGRNWTTHPSIWQAAVWSLLVLHCSNHPSIQYRSRPMRIAESKFCHSLWSV